MFVLYRNHLVGKNLSIVDLTFDIMIMRSLLLHPIYKIAIADEHKLTNDDTIRQYSRESIFRATIMGGIAATIAVTNILLNI